MGGPPSQEEIDRTVRWVEHRLRHHYRQAAIHLPPRFTRREWGFLFLGRKGMVRHTAFRHRDDLARFLVRRAPAHCYYSTAYYDDPGAPRMNQKGWRGADLIFDLDADHLEGHEDLTYGEMLREIRDATRYVLDEFILGQFGFDPDDVHLVFSGGRGYHIHVTDPRVLDLDSDARREIVDHVTGLGLDEEGLVREKALSQDDFGRPEKARFLPRPDEPGWRGLIARQFVAFMDEIADLPREEATARLVELPGVGEKTAQKVIREASTGQWRRTRGLGEDGGEGMNVTAFPTSALKALIPRIHLESEGEADEPVTPDTKRLIRLPGSLHGKTFLRVTPLTLEGLDDFDPLRDAVAFGTDPVELKVPRPMEVTLGDVTYEVQPGVQELPERVALFLVGQRNGVLA